MDKNKLTQEFEDIVNKIIDSTYTINKILSKDNFCFDNDLEAVKKEYKIREENIKLLNDIFSSTQGTKLILTDTWNNFMNKANPIELKNRELLKIKNINIADSNK